MRVRKSHWYDWVIGIVSLVILGLTTFYLWVLWNTFTQQIPVSYSFWGIPKITATYGNHGPIRDTLITGWVIQLLLTVIALFPGMWRSGVQISEKEKQAILPYVRTMLETGKLVFSLYYSYLAIATARSMRLFVLTRLLLIILVLIILIYGIYRCDRAMERVKKQRDDDSADGY